MIQQTNREPRRPAASPPPQSEDDPATATSDGPEIWGKWSGRKHYSLEVVQHPLRARMCGFGDKDRRPLAPAAVAKMVVRNEDNSIVDVDEIDWSFFLVTVDLWSADGKQEMNLVLHPSSADRYMPIPSSKNRRRGTSINQQPSGHHTPIQPSPAPSSYRGSEPTPSTPLPTYTAHHQGYFSSTTPTATTTPTDSSYSSQQQQQQQQQQHQHQHQQDNCGWGYANTASNTPGVDRSTTYPPPILPSIHTFAAATSQTSAWDANDPYHPLDPNSDPKAHDPSVVYASAPYAQHPQQQQHPQSIQLGSSNPQQQQQQQQQQQPHPSYTPPYTSTPPSAAPSANYSTSNHSTSNSQTNNIGGSGGSNDTRSLNTTSVNAPVTTSYPPMPSPRLAYTRTLVGPLSANACRLQDEHRKPGIFFLFQDLSVRTEGNFRLRLRLMNVGAPPAPEYGATRVHTDVSPVLAQTFTEAFTVFSAKRFPGVPDTTALSIAFGNQGQKIPLRNRHGPAKRARRNSSSEEDDDSDDAE